MTPADYKSKIASRYLPVDPAQIGIKIIESDYYLCSVKYDGHLGILTVKNGKASLVDRNGSPVDAPSILEAAKALKGSFTLAGEICVFNDGKPGRNFEVPKALANPKKADLRFAVFDLIDDDGQTPPTDPKEKFSRISKLTGKQEAVFTVEQEAVESRKDIISFFNQAITDHEGIVVRSSNGVVYKVKPVITLDLVVLGFAEGIGDRQGKVRDLMLGYITGKNQYQIIANCSNGLTEDQRKEWYDLLADAAVESDYIEVSGAKTAYVMVKPEHVCEISCLDIISENSSGPIRKATLEYQAKSGYAKLKMNAAASLISPVFQRLRTDKKATAEDAGIKQVEPYLTVSEDGHDDTIKPSKIVAREIFTKSGKGGTAIRKFVTIKTNKEDTGKYSPFAVIYTDFSGGRKTPMEQEIFLCQSAADASKKVDELKEENIKKGWNPYKD